MQTLLQLNNGAAIKVTTARYYTPSGRSIQAEGIKPDVVIDRLKIEKLEKEQLGVKESDLSGHLEQDKSDNSSNSKEADKNQDKAAELEDLLERDYELGEAMRLVKAMALAQKMQK